MASIGFVPVIGSAVNYLFGGAATYVNCGVAIMNAAPWLGDLAAGFSNSASPEMKSLHGALKGFYEASDKNDFQAFTQAAKSVEDAINVLHKAQNPREHFKKGTWTGSWDNYLKPLLTLKNSLEHFRTRGIDGFDTGTLETPIKEAVAFMNKEIEGQKGMMNKLMSKGIEALKNEIGDAFNNSNPHAAKVIKHWHPLFRLQEDLRELRFNQKDHYDKSVDERLEKTLLDLEKCDPRFEGVYNYVMQNSQPLVSDMDKHIFEFMINQVVPELDNKNLLYQEIYDSALIFNHVNHHFTTQNSASQKQWGQDWFKDTENDAKERSTLFSAVGSVLEIEKFEPLTKKLQLSNFPSKEEVAKKINLAIATLQQHPSISKAPQFSQTFETLIKSYIDTTHQLHGKTVTSELDIAYRANIRGHFGEALVILRETYKKQDPNQSSHAISESIQKLKTMGERFGVPTEALETLEGVAKTIEEKAGAFMGGKKESPSNKNLPPLLQLQAHIEMYQREPNKYLPAVVENNLMLDLDILEASSPDFVGIKSFIHEHLGKHSIETIITSFICGMNIQTDDFYEAFYHAVNGQGLLTNQRRNTKEGQIEVGKKLFNQGFNHPLMKKALWHAVTDMQEIAKLKTLSELITPTENATLQEISEKIDLGIALLEGNSYLQKAPFLLSQITGAILPLVNLAYKVGGAQLTKKEQNVLEGKINSAYQKQQDGKHLEALKILKEVFETGPLAEKVKKSPSIQNPSSAVEELSNDFIREMNQTSTEKTPDQNEWDKKIGEQKTQLIENITCFSTFKVVQNFCGYTDEEQNAEQYQEIAKELTDLEGPKRQEKFLELLKAKIYADNSLGFLDKMTGSLMAGFVFHTVGFFSSRVVTSFIDHIQSFMLDPVQAPLTNAHHAPIKGINDAILSLLSAEEIWSKDSEGKEGVKSKGDKIYQILSDPKLNGGYKIEELFSKAIQKGIESFFSASFFSATADEENPQDVGLITSFIETLFNGLAYVPRMVLSPFVSIIATMSSYALKKGSGYLVNKLELVNTVMDTVNSVVGKDNKYTSGIDQIIYDQLLEVEKLLDEEGGGAVLQEGRNGKRLFDELVSNLFKLLDERSNLSPGQVEKRDSFLKQLVGDMNDLSDAQLKGVVRDLLIFCYETLRTEKGMNGTLHSILEKVNQGLQPKIPENRLFQVYDRETIDKIKADKAKTVSANIENRDKVIRRKVQNELATRFRKKYSIKGEILNHHIDTALNEKYQNVEQGIFDTLDRILNKAIGNIVTAQVDSVLKTPEESIKDHLAFIENQLIPYKAKNETKEKTYIEEMKELSQSENAQVKMQKRHEKFLRGLNKSLKELKAKEGADPKTALQVQTLYKMTHQMLPLLEEIGTNIAKGGDVSQSIKALETKMKEQEGLIAMVRYTIETKEESLLDTAMGIKNSFIQQLGKGAAPLVTEYVKGRLKGRIDEGIMMYKDPNALQAMLRHVVLLNFANQKGKPKGKDNQQRQVVVDAESREVSFSDEGGPMDKWLLL